MSSSRRALELAAARGDTVYCTFVDLQKAYDSVPRSHLFATLWGELGVT